MAGWLFQPLLPGGTALLSTPPEATIDQTCPWVSQELEVGSASVITLPDATTEPCAGRVWRLGPFIITDALGLVVQASNGQTITVGASVSVADGNAYSASIGDMIELFAIGGNWIGRDYPEGAWVIT